MTDHPSPTPIPMTDNHMRHFTGVLPLRESETEKDPIPEESIDRLPQYFAGIDSQPPNPNSKTPTPNP